MSAKYESFEAFVSGFTVRRRPQLPQGSDYAALGVSVNASAADVKAAYRRLAIRLHPDRGGDGARLAAVNVARDRILEALAVRGR